MASPARCCLVAFCVSVRITPPRRVARGNRNKHIMIDLGTGNNNKINWPLQDKQEFIDIVEVVYRCVCNASGYVCVFACFQVRCDCNCLQIRPRCYLVMSCGGCIVEQRGEERTGSRGVSERLFNQVQVLRRLRALAPRQMLRCSRCDNPCWCSRQGPGETRYSRGWKRMRCRVALSFSPCWQRRASLDQFSSCAQTCRCQV